MVRFGSPDLRTSALGVKRVRGSVSPWSRGRAGPKKAPNCQNSKICPRSTFRGDLLLRRSTLKEGSVRNIFTMHWSPHTHPSLNIDLPKSRSPLKVDRGQCFEFWQFGGLFWRFFWPGSRGKRFLGPVSPPVHLSGGRGTQIGPSGGHLWVWDPSLKVDRP